MDPQFKPLLETSCFSPQCPYEYDMAEMSFNNPDSKSNPIRKLSFRDTFDASNNSADVSDELLTDIFFSNRIRRKMTNEFLMSNLSPKKFCDALNCESDHNDHNHESHSNIAKGPIQILVSTPGKFSTDQLDTFLCPQVSTYSTNNTMMDEEGHDMPALEPFQEYEGSLTDKIDHSNLLTPNKDADYPLEMKTDPTYSGNREDLASPCLKSSHSVPNWTYESPSKRYNNSSLATCKNQWTPDLRSITPETLVELMNNTEGRTFLIIDCRYEYEYRGGHIRGAVNITSPDDLEELLIKHRHLVCDPESLEHIKEDWKMALEHPRTRKNSFNLNAEETKPPIIVFHCEFSQKRGPRALRALRTLDTTLNHTCWPNLYYPEVYILENGYKHFHSKFPEHCDPINQYIRMVDKLYKTHYVEAKMRDRQLWKKGGGSNEASPKPVMLQRNKTITV